jgi:hypothetical protein
MDPGLLFQIATAACLPPWLLLMAAPRWRFTERIAGFVMPFLFCTAYMGVFLHEFHRSSASGITLESVMVLFASPWVALGGWIHYLAFDLFVGAWEVRDARRLEVPHLQTIPFLLLTLMFGPIGLACYLLFRLAKKREAEL